MGASVCKNLGSHHKIGHLRVRLAIGVSDDVDFAGGNLVLTDDDGHACVWAYVERRPGHHGRSSTCSLWTNLIETRLACVPCGPDNFLSFTLEIDWEERQIQILSVNGVPCCDEDEFHSMSCRGIRFVRLFNMRGEGIAAAWRDLHLAAADAQLTSLQERIWSHTWPWLRN